MDAPDPGADGGYRIETPERVELEYDVARLGSRLLAAIVDTVILGFAMILTLVLGTLGLAFALGLASAILDIDDSSFGQWALAGAVLLTFGLLWGYYVFFEMVWHGQSPGKRWTGLRVIKEGGYPVGFADSAIRNLVRLVDFLPSGYALGSLVMLIDRRSRRLGDLAAGTLVVKERRELRLESLIPAPAGGAAPAPAVTDAWLAEPEPDALAEAARRLPLAEQALLREYFQRRESLAIPARAALAAHLARTLARKLEHDLGTEPPEQFLERLARHLWGQH